ncbi:MAG TPA: cyclic nucleotide-binding domain-containing protein, partial [Anaerolineales bacterium]|nr:cyclic nucleotide-binding domain-containing protein [Anaerolineales bacterium]
MSVNLLARIPFFTSLPPGELDRLMEELDVVNLNSGDILFHEGDPGEHLYVVVEGELEILLAPDTDDELILNLLHEGEYLGEMSLLQPGGLRTASARARGNVVLLSMNREHFKALLQRHPELANAMIGVLSQRLDNTNAATFRDLTEKNRQLQQAFDELKEAQEQLIEKERLERELKVAADIQMSILPDVLPVHDK